MKLVGKMVSLRASVSVVALLFFSSVAMAEETGGDCASACDGGAIGVVADDPGGAGPVADDPTGGGNPDGSGGEDGGGSDAGPDDGTIVIDDGWVDPGDDGWVDSGDGDGDGGAIDPGIDPGDDGWVDPGDGGVIEPGEDGGTGGIDEGPAVDPVVIGLPPEEGGEYPPEVVYTMADDTAGVGGPQVQRGHGMAVGAQTAHGRPASAIPDQCSFGGRGLFGLCAGNAP